MTERSYKNLRSNIVLPSAYKIDSKNLLFSTSINKYQPSHAITWSLDIKIRLRDFFLKCSYPYRKTYFPPHLEDLTPHIHRFFISLDAYIDSANPVIPEKEILFGATEKDFATYLKRVRTKSFLTTTGSTSLELPEWWHEIPQYQIKDIGDIFNFQYLIHFSEEVEDYKYGDVPYTENIGYIKKFKQTLRNLLPEELPCDIIDPREVLLTNSGSSAIREGSITDKTYLIKQQTNGFNKSRDMSKRCVVQAAPAGARDTCINTINDINTIKLIEYQTALLLEKQFREFTVDKTLEDFDIKYRNFQKNSKFFLCRDITKEGITKPRPLLTAMMEVLHETYPEVPGWDFTDFYNTYELSIDGKIHKPIRGHGLGMANALTTLMQIVLFHQILEKCEYMKIEPTMLTHNDDIIIGFQKNQDIEEFWSVEEKVFSKLGILRNPQKSFRGKRSGVFIEKYFYEFSSIISRKESYQRRELLLALTASNIVHAKQMVSSLVYLENEIISLNFPEVISYWGYEFWKEEHLYPATCGGWFNRSIYGISLDLKTLDDLPYSDQVEKAYHACKNNRIYPKFEKGDYKSPIQKIYPNYAFLIEDKHKLDFDIGPLNEINRSYNRLRFQPWQYELSWNRLLKKRKETYDKYISHLPYKDFIKLIVNESNKDFLPLDFMIKSEVQGEIHEGTVDDIYHTSNPKMSYLSALTPIDDIYPNRYSINFLNIDSIQHRITADQRKRLNSFVGILSLTSKMRKDTFLAPKDSFEEFFECYRTPFRLFKVYGELESPLLPLLKEEYRPKILSEKKSIFGRFLSKKEYFAFEKIKFRPKVIKFLMDLHLEDPEDFLTTLELPKRTTYEVYKTESETSSSEEEFFISKDVGLTPANFEKFKEKKSFTEFPFSEAIFREIDSTLQRWLIIMSGFEENNSELQDAKNELLDSISPAARDYLNNFYFGGEVSQSEEEYGDDGFDFEFL